MPGHSQAEYQLLRIHLASFGGLSPKLILKGGGGEHNRPGNDRGLFSFALEMVRKNGGVLEHPAKSRAWAAHGLSRPIGAGWQKCIDGGWVCEVWQSAYGHKAAKATWLYCSGNPIPARWSRTPGTHQIGFHDQRGKALNKPTVSRFEANSTPEDFAMFLIEIAKASSRCNGTGRVKG